MTGSKKGIETVYRFFLKYGIYIAAAAVVLLNLSLIFDNVVWGDEAFTVNITQGTGFAGVLQRVYYWDTHPVFYYWYVHAFTLIFGGAIWAYHLASVVPFTICVILTVTFIKKRLGSLPAYLILFIMGLSRTGAEYNLEIRMYELCFLLVFVCAVFSVKLFESMDPKFFIALVIFGVLSAYTHYYGLVATGILLFADSLVYFLVKKGKSWIYGVVSIVVYLLLYSPWMWVLLKQGSMAVNESWATTPKYISNLFKFMLGGEHVAKVLYPVLILLAILYVLKLFNVAVIEDKKLKFQKPKAGKTDAVDLVLFACCITVILTLAFGYFMYFFINPIAFEARYLHPLMPVLLLMLCIFLSRFLTVKSGNDCEKKEDELLTSGSGVIKLSVTAVVLTLVFVLGLLDFKQYRSEVKVQDACTAEVLQIMGEMSEEKGLVSVGVKHLAWTVFEHYFPKSPVYGSLSDIPETAADVWVFYDPYMTDANRQALTDRGYEITEYLDKNFGKYHCNLYHLTK